MAAGGWYLHGTGRVQRWQWRDRSIRLCEYTRTGRRCGRRNQRHVRRDERSGRGYGWRGRRVLDYHQRVRRGHRGDYGGGGGGGAALNGNTSGPGGNGGKGIVCVAQW